jgi:hypothetical protein
MKIVIVLFLSERTDPEILVDTNHYAVSMGASSYFSGADFVAQIAATVEAAGNLQTAMNAPWSEGKTADVQVARNALDYQLNKLASMVENKANDPTQPDDVRIEIAKASGMKRKDQYIPQIHKFTVKNTENSGVVRCTAEGDANAHLYEYTFDLVNYANRVRGKESTNSTVEFTVSEVGRKTAFFHKAIKPNEEPDWEGPLFLIVT